SPTRPERCLRRRSALQLSAFSFSPPSRLPCEGIAAAPIAEDQVRKCELAHTSVRLSKKQRLTELCWKRDATGGCGGGFGLEGWLPGNCNPYFCFCLRPSVCC